MYIHLDHLLQLPPLRDALACRVSQATNSNNMYPSAKTLKYREVVFSIWWFILCPQPFPIVHKETHMFHVPYPTKSAKEVKAS